jgi:hypothetical protein
LNRLIAVSSLMKPLHNADAMDAFSLKGCDTLVDEPEHRDKERNPLSLGERATDDRSGEQRLAEARRRLKHGPATAGSQRAPQRREGAFLMRS